MEAVIENTRRDALIEEYQEYVHYVVAYLIQSMNLPKRFFDEFVSAGYLGLVEAAERFDFDSGHPFKNFAFLRIRGAVIDSIRECSELSGKAYQYARALRAAHTLRQSQADEEATKQTKKFQRPGDKVGSVLDFAAKSVLAFRLTLSECENSLSTSGTYGESPEVLLQEKQSQKKFRDLIATLPEKERLVIEEYYFNDKSLSEIAEENEGLSKSWVSRLHARGIDHLLEKINDSKEEETT